MKSCIEEEKVEIQRPAPSTQHLAPVDAMLLAAPR